MRVISLEIAVKKSALVLILFAAGTINAMAADMPVKAPPPSRAIDQVRHRREQVRRCRRG